MSRFFILTAIGVACAVSLSPCVSLAQAYDPLSSDATLQSVAKDLAIEDQARSRTIPLRIYLPASKVAEPVILLSHGLGGSRLACSYAAKHWSARGYVVVSMQHAGSDEAVWKNIPIRKRKSAMKDAANVKNTVARFGDVKAVLNELERWNESSDHPLRNRFDLTRVGMSGHSYGAATTQGVSGQAIRLVGQRYTDKRIDAAIMFSPNARKRADPQLAFGKVSIPWMMMTGTRDTSPINDTTVADRRKVYPGLPINIDKYELVLDGAEHSAFGDVGRRTGNRNANHHRVILALSTAFWDTHLRNASDARTWLHGAGPQSVLESKDVWQMNLRAREESK